MESVLLSLRALLEKAIQSSKQVNSKMLVNIINIF